MPKKTAKTKAAAVVPDPRKQGGSLRAIGLLMVLVAAASFAVNFGIWHLKEIMNQKDLDCLKHQRCTEINNPIA